MAKIIANAAARYIAGPRRAEPFWQWQDEERVVAWRPGTGRTIAFSQEVAAVIEALAPQGLPPLGAILLLLAACQPWWDEKSMNEARIAWHLFGAPDDDVDEEYLSELADLLGRKGLAPDMHGWREACEFLYKAVIEGLMQVKDLPEDLRCGLDAKVELAKIVFEPCTNRCGQDYSRSVLAGFRAGLPSALLKSRSGGSPMVDIIKALYEGLCLAPLDERRLRLLRRTGLESLPLPAEVELPTGQTIRELLARLADDVELAGLAALARDLMAVVHLPRRLAEPENLPVGGLSDITNRGTLDRLLPSELVHDDLTLAVRVALNEALYWRRESPRRNEVVRRRILVDSGIRLWGIPRLYAAAVALAAAATTPAGAQVHCYCCHSKQLVPVNLSSQAGLIEVLEALETEAHPGEVIQEFLNTTNSPTDADNILITHADVLADVDFQRHLGEANNSPLYIVSVDREGNYRLSAYSGLSHRVMSEARLDLSSILADDHQRVELVDEAEADRLPAACRLKEFPLLLPVPIDWERAAWREDTGLVHATNDGRLMQWRQPNRGARQVTARLPNIVLWQTMLLDARQCCLVPEKFSNPLVLLMVDLDAGSIKTINVALPEEFDLMAAVCPIQGGLGLVGQHAALAVSCQTGEVLAELHEKETIPPMGVTVGQVRLQQNLFRKVAKDGKAHRPGWHSFASYGEKLSFLRLDVPPRDSKFPEMVSTVCPGVAVCEDLWAAYHDGVVVYVNVSGIRYGHLPEFRESTGTTFMGPPAGGRRLCAECDDGGRKTWTCYELSEPDHKQVMCEPDPPKRHVVENRDSAIRFLVGCPDELGRCPSEPPPTDIFKYNAVTVTESLICLRRHEGDWLMFGRSKEGMIDSSWRSLWHGEPSAECSDLGVRYQTVPFTEEYCAKGEAYRLRQATWPSGAKAWLDSRGLLHLRSCDPATPELTLVLGLHAILAGWTSNGLRAGEQEFFGEPVDLDDTRFASVLFKAIQGLRA